MFRKPITHRFLSTLENDQRLSSIFESKTPPVVIFPVSHAVGLSVIRTLEDHDIPILGLDFKKKSAGHYSKRVVPLRLPSLYDSIQTFVEGMLSLGKCFRKRPVLFCVDDEDLFLTLKYQDMFEKYYRLPLSPWKIVENIVDKGKFYKILSDNNFPIPETWHFEDLDSLLKQKDDIKYPCILKPTYSTTFRQYFSVKAKRFDAFSDLFDYAQVVSKAGIKFIIQEYIPGNADKLITFAAYSDEQGNVISSFTGRKVHQFPPDFGTCRLGESIVNVELEKLGRRLLKIFEFRGISLTEFKVDQEGNIKAIELNPRPGDWPERLAQLCGANIVLTAYKDTLGESVENIRADRLGVKWANISEDLYYCIRGYRLLGYPHAHRGVLKWLKDLKGLETGAFFSWLDPIPAIVRTQGMMKDFWEREKELRNKKSEGTFCG